MLRALLIISILLIMSCDTKYGVFRQADLGRLIDHKCIKHSMESVQEVTDIKYRFMGGRTSKSPDKNESYERHRYNYKTHNINGFISILNNKSGTHITQFSASINRIPAQAEIDKIRPVMDKIEMAVELYCKVDNFPSLVRETCRKVECKK